MSVMEKDLARASTLPSRLYTDPEIYQLEREKIFARDLAAGRRYRGCEKSG